MKKILVIHNTYRNIGGEDIAVENEIKLLENEFHVQTIYYSNKYVNFLSQIFSFLLNQNNESMKKLNQIIDSFQPDFVYVHNTWFKASLGVFKILKDKNIKTIVKLHNFRYDCTKGYFIKCNTEENETCGKCGRKKSKFQIFNKYFTESYIKSFLVNRYGKKYFKILKQDVNKILVLTKFHKNHLIDLGFEAQKIHVFQNYIQVEPNSQLNLEDFIVYAGRISHEKGVSTLIDAFLNSNLENTKLKILGEGPLLKEIRMKYDRDSIEFYGFKSNEETLDIIKKSKAVVTATKLYEGQPTLLCEASSFGVPSVFPDAGGISEFFPSDYSLIFNQNDQNDLVEKLNMLNDHEFISDLGFKNKEYLKSNLNKDRLIGIFKKIIDEL